MALGAGRDFIGRPVCASDLVAWFSSGYPDAIVVAVVESFTDAGRARIRVLKATRWHVVGSTHTVDPKRLVFLAADETDESLDIHARLRAAD